MIEPPLVFLGARLARAMSGHRRLGAWLEKGLGGLFVLLGVKLALSER
nr:hypothetical protein [Halomonas elongata]